MRANTSGMSALDKIPDVHWLESGGSEDKAIESPFTRLPPYPMCLGFMKLSEPSKAEVPAVERHCHSESESS